MVWLKLLPWLAIVALLAALHVSRADLREAKAQHAEALAQRDADIAHERERATIRVLAAERRHAEAVDALAQTYEREKADAQARADAVVADLRAGNLRLHQRWEAARATADLVSGVAAAARSTDDGADDRASSASRIVRAAALCDSQVRGLQALVREDRKTCGANQ